MQSATGLFRAFRFSSSDLPEPDRIPICRDIFGQRIVKLDIEPSPESLFRFDADVLLHPALAITNVSASPGRLNRSQAMLSDNNDEFALIMNIEGRCAGRQSGREATLDAGDAVLISHTEPGILTYDDSRFVGVSVPRMMLSPLVAQVSDATARRIPARTEALRLLRRYLTVLRDNGEISDSGVCGLAVSHIHDLMAVAIGATRDGGDLARRRGVRAARLASVKTDITTNLRNRDLSVGAVARRHGVTPRYIQQMFEEEGQTYTQFVLIARLDLAHRLLAAQRYAHCSITDIAYATGFGDLSYFNRTFRRQYGTTPSDVRADARVPDNGNDG